MEAPHGSGGEKSMSMTEVESRGFTKNSAESICRAAAFRQLDNLVVVLRVLK